MIVKELDPFAPKDRFEEAGREAEKQIAFYLRRAFADERDILVLNGLRLERNGDAAQIDHLVLHPYGAIIIESKSVTGRIKINKRGEWARWYRGHAEGMPSPLLQANRQADFLLAYLDHHPIVLAGKALLIGTRVAISDEGIIDAPQSVDLDQVFKADQIPKNIRQTIQARKALLAMPTVFAKMLVHAGGGTVVGDEFSNEDLARISAFLVEHNRPLRFHRQAPAAGTSKVPVCRHCGSADLSIEYGYSHHFKCLSCKKNFAIHAICSACGGQGHIRKAGLHYYLDCIQCGVSELFYVNRVTVI